MLRSLMRWSALRHVQRENLVQLAELAHPRSGCQHQQLRHLSVTFTYCKKRKPAEERAVENQGRRVLRYSKTNSKVVGIWRDMTVRDIAKVLDKDVEHVLSALEFADKSDRQYGVSSVVSSAQVVRDVVKICGCRFKIVPQPGADEEEHENKDAVPAPPAPLEALRPRPAVACVMGHVDHGKTTLLDALRDSHVVDTEFGGITQHIGAFEVRLESGETVTFVDTPGHAAFAAMRARGARGADVVVLVVAADDGVMEQTKESIRMAREANVPIIVAVNKIDKPGVDIDRTLRALAANGVVCEALGGDVQAVPVSARERTNLQALVEALSLQATLMDLRADPSGPVEGVVLEAQLDQRSGKQATVLVQRGTLRRGAVLVAGLAWAKVRALRSAEGLSLEAAGPSAPAAVLGWRDLPQAGDQVLEVPSEKRAHEVMKWRHGQHMRSKQQEAASAIAEKALEHRQRYEQQLARRRALGRFKMRPDGPRQKMIQDDTHPTLSVVIKGDVDGSVEAILDIVDTYDDHETVRLDLVHFGVGHVTPSDVEIAEAFKATIFAFNVEVPVEVASEAKARGVPVATHNVIYKLVDQLKDELSARIPLRQDEEVIGSANVLAQFWVSSGKGKVPVAGARCVKGELRRDALYRLIRDNQLVYEGQLASMKHLKDEVTTIKRDMECGLRLADSAVEVKPGDTLVCFRLVDAKQQTSWDPGF